MRIVPGALGSVAFVYATTVGATVEPPAVSDARSAALGSTGVAYSDSAAAVYHNPAALSGVERGLVTLSVSPFFPKLRAPIGGTEEDSDRGFFPMFLAGGAYRLTDELVLGVAAYPVLGFGGEYSNLSALGGESLSVAAATFEASPAVSYAITDRVSLGLGYRVTYMTQDVHQVTPAMGPGGDPVLVASDVSLSGMNFLGVHAGVLAHVADGTRLGLTYRNKVTIDLEGEFESAGTELDASSEFAAPHTFKLGLAQELLDAQLMLAVDLKYALYAESSETTSTTIEGIGTTETPLDWNNSLAAGLGVEYRLANDGPRLRLGYGATQSATSEDYPQPFLAPPGFIHSVHAGAGVQLSALELDLGGFYMWSGSEVEPAADSGAEAGEYAINAYVFAVSATYRM
ncbi:MAG TPA: outer membrane protein transport protein [Polyangiaceae bacterium]